MKNFIRSGQSVSIYGLACAFIDGILFPKLTCYRPIVTILRITRNIQNNKKLNKQSERPFFLQWHSKGCSDHLA